MLLRIKYMQNIKRESFFSINELICNLNKKNIFRTAFILVVGEFFGDKNTFDAYYNEYIFFQTAINRKRN